MRAGLSRPLIFVVMSLLVVALMYSSLSEFYVFAEPPDPCFGTGCEGGYCMDTFLGVVQCCWLGPNGMTDICQECWTDDDGEFYYCDPPRTKGRSDTGVFAPPPSGVAPPPPTESCPENTARDVNGNCTPLTQTPETPVPKSGLGNLLPEGVFEGPASLEELPQGAPPTAEDGSEQPPNQPLCPEGQVLDDETGVCVPIECPEGQVLDEETGLCFRIASPQDAAQEQEAAEDQPQEVEEPEEQQQIEEEPPSEESSSEEDISNN
jgi:hypothetical protein